LAIDSRLTPISGEVQAAKKKKKIANDRKKSRKENPRVGWFEYYEQVYDKANTNTKEKESAGELFTSK
jgi:hypothetical protein